MNAFGKEVRPDRVAIYIRWSTDDQGDGTTLEVQREGCQHYLLSQGWQVTPALIYIDDGCSGGTLERPGLAALRRAVLAGHVDCVVVYKIDRLSRSVMDTVNLVLGEWEGRTHLKSAREPIDTATAVGKQFFYMLVSYAEWERSVIKERTLSGKLRRAREGRNPGGPVPFGYRLSGQAGMLEVDPPRAEIVRRIYRMYLSEAGTYRIAGALNQDGIPSPTGGRWSVTTLVKLLKNPLYAGRRVYGRLTTNPRRQRDRSLPWYQKNPDPIVAPSQFPAIVPAEEFDRVQALIASRAAPQAGRRALSSDYLLTGLLACRCGAPMVSHSSYRGTARLYSYYHCQQKKSRGGGACDASLIPQALVDGEVERMLKGLLQGEEAYQHFLTARWASLDSLLEETEGRRDHAQAALAGLARQAARLNRDYRAGLLPAGLYQENRREIDQESLVLRERLALLEQQAQGLSAQLQEREALREAFDLAHRWEELTLQQRKFVLRHLVESVVAHRPPQSEEVSVQVTWRFTDPT